MLKHTPVKSRTTFVLSLVVICLVMLSSMLLSVAFPNDVTCINGMCIPKSESLPIGGQVSAFFGNLFSTEGWPARWYCGSWTGFHGWTFVIADVITFLSYFGIPLFLAGFLIRRKIVNLPFRNILWLFTFFILFCGFTHMLDAIMFWRPMYNFLGLIKVFTAGVSFATFIALIMESGRLASLKGPQALQREVEERTAELKLLNQQLAEEIDQRKVTEQNLKESLENNETLFLELHHRIKNNLQLVSSLIYLNFSELDEHQHLVKSTTSRIRNMSEVHELLLQTRTVDTVDLREYLSGLFARLSESNGHGGVISNELDIPPDILVDTEKAINIGLIVAEAYTNAVKYAFKDRPSGTIRLTVTRLDDSISITIKDDGVGFQPKENDRQSFGQALFGSFVKNLDGTWSLDTGEWGTSISFQFSVH